MVILKKDPKSLEIAASVLKKGEIIIVPTDTVYGFSGIMPFTKEKIIKIKKREAEKSFIGLIEKPQDIYKYTDTPVPEILLKLWPAPLSIIVRDKEGALYNQTGCLKNKFLVFYPAYFFYNFIYRNKGISVIDYFDIYFFSD